MTISHINNLPDEIKTERLILRAPSLKDKADLQELANNKEIHKFLARLPHPYKEEHAIDFINNLARTKQEHAYAIISKTDGFIGVIGWHLDRELGLELGYWIGQGFWGKGYASEAAKAMIIAAKDCGHKKLFARSITANIGSIRVLEKAGFIIIDESIDDCGVHKGIMVTFLKCE
ncbi:MAG: GNAT family N-acetyltransferase [Devosiaceae bacterium]|nr:GNAT family N-acetyltransferase [Devosiaceae bacterium]